MPQSTYNLYLTAHPELPKEAIINIGIHHEFIERFQLLIKKYGIKNEFNWHMMADIFDLLELIFNPQKLSPQKKDSRIVRSLGLLNDPSLLHLSLRKIAHRAGLGYNNFRKLFQATLGVSPGNYRIDKRIGFARQMLSGSLTPQETAEALAYSDVYAFSRQFKQRTGMTPGEFTRSL